MTKHWARATSGQWPTWLLLPFLAAFCACSPAIDHDLACSVTSTYFSSRLEGEAAWEWPAEARRLVDANSWTNVSRETFANCPSATIPVIGLAFSADRSLVQITRSSYLLHEIENIVDPEGGSIDTCLLRRNRRNAGGWEVVGCKLDVTS